MKALRIKTVDGENILIPRCVITCIKDNINETERRSICVEFGINRHVSFILPSEESKNAAFDKLSYWLVHDDGLPVLNF